MSEITRSPFLVEFYKFNTLLAVTKMPFTKYRANTRVSFLTLERLVTRRNIHADVCDFSKLKTFFLNNLPSLKQKSAQKLRKTANRLYNNRTTPSERNNIKVEIIRLANIQLEQIARQAKKYMDFDERYCVMRKKYSCHFTKGFGNGHFKVGLAMMGEAIAALQKTNVDKPTEL